MTDKKQTAEEAATKYWRRCQLTREDGCIVFGDLGEAFLAGVAWSRENEGMAASENRN